MILFWTLFITLTSIYFLISLLLFSRSKKQCVVSRSPVILQVSHWSNLTEMIFTLVMMCRTDLGLANSSQLTFWLIETGMQIAHYLMGFSYIVRGYRLYFIFHLGAAWEIEDNMFFINRHRATQRWSGLLLLIMISPLAVCFTVIIIVLSLDDNSVPLYVPASGGLRTTGHYMVIMGLEFLLELFLIIMIYKLRIVEDEFQMTKELIFVTICLSGTTIISIFAHINRSFLFVYLLVNICLMVFSSIWPVVLSFTVNGSIQLISEEILNSFRLILQHPLTLNAFEKFVRRNSEEAFNLLDIYLSCEVFQSTKNREIGLKLLEKIPFLEKGVPCFELKSVDLDDEFCFNTVLNYCFLTLEEDYYCRFGVSEEFGFIKRKLRRQEIFLNRISETSLGMRGNMDDVRSSLISIIKDYSNS